MNYCNRNFIIEENIKPEILQYIDDIQMFQRKRRLLCLRFYLLGKNLLPTRISYLKLMEDLLSNKNSINLFLDNFKHFVTTLETDNKILVFQCKKEFVETINLLTSKADFFCDDDRNAHCNANIFAEKIISVKGQQKWLKGIELVDLKVEQE